MSNQHWTKWIKFWINFNFCILYRLGNKAVCSDTLNWKIEDCLVYTNLDDDRIKNWFQMIFSKKVFDTVVFYDFII